MDNTTSSLPHNTLAEQKVLGMVLLENSHFWQVAEKLSPEDFYIPQHKIIYEAMIDASKAGISDFDAVKLSSLLKKNKKLELVGGIKELSKLLTDLQFGVVKSSDITDYIEIIREASYQRQKIKLSARLTSELMSGDSDSVRGTQKELFDLEYEASQKSLTPTTDFAHDILEATFEKGKTGKPVVGFRTGIRDFDYFTTGLSGGQLVILAARPGVGKSALSLNMATYAALYENSVICDFSLEMSKEELFLRACASEARVPFQKLKTGMLDTSEWERIIYVSDSLGKSKLYVDDFPSADTLYIESAVQNVIIKEGRVDLIIVDYLQLMEGSSKKYESRQVEVSGITRELKILAKKLNVPIIALSQLNRGPAGSKPRKPILSDLRESGAIEQDADIVVFIYREEDEEAMASSAPIPLAELIIAKQRNGSTGSIAIGYNMPIIRFENLYKST